MIAKHRKFSIIYFILLKKNHFKICFIVSVNHNEYFVPLVYLNGRQYTELKNCAKNNFIMHDPKYYRSVLGATAQHMRILKNWLKKKNQFEKTS